MTVIDCDNLNLDLPRNKSFRRNRCVYVRPVVDYHRGFGAGVGAVDCIGDNSSWHETTASVRENAM